jgi:Zn-dependent protease with chaperone function
MHSSRAHPPDRRASSSDTIEGEIAQFIEVALHMLLRNRSLYPVSLFVPRRSYGAPVPISRHPLLNTYVSTLAASVRAWLRPGEVQRLAFVVLDPARSTTNRHSPHARCIERVVFEIKITPSASASRQSHPSTDAHPAAPESDPPMSMPEVVELHAQFAAVLRRIHDANGHFTARRPKVCTWTVLLYTNQARPPPSSAPTSGTTSGSIHAGGAGASHRSVAAECASAAAAPSWHPIPLHSHDAVDASGSSAATPFLDFPPHSNRIAHLKSVRTTRLQMEVYAEAAGPLDEPEAAQRQGRETIEL